MSARRMTKRTSWCLSMGVMSLLMMGTASADVVQLPEVPQPNPDSPVDYEALIRQILVGDLKDNGVDAYLEAYKLIEPFEGDWGKTLDGPWTEDDEVERWLRKNRKGLEALRRAMQHEGAWFDENDEAGAKAMDVHRDATKGLIAQGYHDWAKGQPDALIDNALAVLRSGHHLSSVDNILSLLSLASKAIALDTLVAALDLSDDRDAVSQRVWPALNAMDEPYLPYVMRLRVTRLNYLYVLQRTGKLDDLPAFNAYFDALEEWANTPYWRPEGRGDALEAKTLEPPPACLFLDPPAMYPRGRELHERGLAMRRATHLIYALHVHRAEHGTFPRSLDELELRDLGQLRIDPFSGED